MHAAIQQQGVVIRSVTGFLMAMRFNKQPVFIGADTAFNFSPPAVVLVFILIQAEIGQRAVENLLAVFTAMRR